MHLKIRNKEGTIRFTFQAIELVSIQIGYYGHCFQFIEYFYFKSTSTYVFKQNQGHSMK